MIYAMHAINLWHATNHWCNRGSIRLLGCPDSLQLVATWCKMVVMIGDSDGDIYNSRSHAPLLFNHWLVHRCTVENACMLHISCHHRHCRINMIVGLQHYPIKLSGSHLMWDGDDDCDDDGDGCDKAGHGCDNDGGVDRRAIIRWLLLPLTCL